MGVAASEIQRFLQSPLEGTVTLRRSERSLSCGSEDFYAAAAASRQISMVTARNVRWVLAEVKWRSTLKVLKTAACVDDNRCAVPALLKRRILSSRRRVGRCEFSTRLSFPLPRTVIRI